MSYSKNMNTTYPNAESFAKSMSLPITVCKVTRELYNRTVPALNEPLASNLIARAGFPKGTPAHEAAMDIVRARFESYFRNSF